MSKQERFDLSPRDPQGGVWRSPHRDPDEARAYREHLKQSDLDSGGNLTGEEATNVRFNRAAQVAGIFEDQQRRDMDMEIARRLALGRREETRSVRPGRRASLRTTPPTT